MRDRAVAQNAVDQPARAVVVVADLQVVGTALGDQPVGAVVLVGGDVALIVRFGVDVARRIVDPVKGFV